MVRILLQGGAYRSKSLDADDQRCINLYVEKNPEINQPSAPATHYLTPGLTLLIEGTVESTVRQLYTTSTGVVYTVIGANIYYVNTAYDLIFIGSVSTSTTPVSLQDNGIVIVVVDGSSAGYVIDMATNNFSPIYDSAFYGATKTNYLDTFLIFNRPGTNQLYISASNANYDIFVTPAQIVAGTISAGGINFINGTYSNIPLLGGSGSGATANITVVGNTVTGVVIVNPGINYAIDDSLTISKSNVGGTGIGFIYLVNTVTARAFDPLDIAAKTTYPDPIQSIIVIQGYIWLIGTQTSEVWYNAGNADFPFQRLPGVNIIEHGTVAPYSLSAQDVFPYWLAQDKQGKDILVKGENYQYKRISNRAIEYEISQYAVTSDCISFIQQQEGHTFVWFVFPTANKTWVYDEASEEFHERVWTDDDGNFNRHRANCVTNGYGNILVGDWQNANIYSLDSNKYTDNGQPISRVRSFPHLLKNANRISYKLFIADMAVGNDDGSIDGTQFDNPPRVFLRWSDDRGSSYGTPIAQSLGAAGEYLTSIQFQRLGMARDRVFELFWSCPCNTSLQGAWIVVEEAET